MKRETTARSPAEDRSAIVAPFAAEYPFESHDLDVGGLRYHYLDEGPKDGEPLLFVHGNPTWSFHWRHAIQAFSGARRCVAVDHIGCGLSDKPARYDYRLAQHIANLERLVQHLDLRRITLVAHDWGGPIGLGFAERNLERIARVVLLNTSAFTGARAPWRIRVCRTPGFGALAVRGFNAFAVAATVMALERRERMTRAVRRGYLAPYDTFAHRIATLRFVQDIPLSPSHPSWAELARIEAELPLLAHVPIGLVWGGLDWCFTPEHLARFQAVWPHAEAHLEERAGHYVLEDSRERVLQWIERFLARHPLGHGAHP
ncbi:MAG TPA: alpha/beta fold hydrolase [Planctomycetota bacterium]|nr:alpha/beta fold hydrolase [Planctomycetota bacterium]